MYVYMYVCVYIYIYIERERDTYISVQPGGTEAQPWPRLSRRRAFGGREGGCERRSLTAFAAEKAWGRGFSSQECSSP